ncbi:MAG: hypothetical protein ACRCX2_23450 [Paraclostridium sp.]
MSHAQWVFHYLEVLKYTGQEVKINTELLRDIETSIQAFYLIVDKDKGEAMMDAIADIKNKRRNPEDSNEEENYVKLTDTDEELLAFAGTLPKELAMPDDHKHTGKFILPTKNLKEVFGDSVDYEEVDSLSDLGDTKSNGDEVNIVEIDSIDDAFEPGLG